MNNTRVDNTTTRKWIQRKCVHVLREQMYNEWIVGTADQHLLYIMQVILFMADVVISTLYHAANRLMFYDMMK